MATIMGRNHLYSRSSSARATKPRMCSSTAASGVALHSRAMEKLRAIRPASWWVSATSEVFTLKLVWLAPFFIVFRMMWKRNSSKNLRM